MSKIGQHILDMPYEELPEPDLTQDPAYIAWAEQQGEEDLIIQDSEND